MVKINRLKTSFNQNQGSVFQQVLSQVEQKCPDLSCFRIARPNRIQACLGVQLIEESAIDSGGPFRELVSTIIEECSNKLAMFVKSR